MKTRIKIMIEIDEDPDVLRAMVRRNDPLIRTDEDVNAQDILSYITNDDGEPVKVENGSSTIEAFE